MEEAAMQLGYGLFIVAFSLLCFVTGMLIGHIWDRMRK